MLTNSNQICILSIDLLSLHSHSTKKYPHRENKLSFHFWILACHNFKVVESHSSKALFIKTVGMITCRFTTLFLALSFSFTFVYKGWCFLWKLSLQTWHKQQIPPTHPKQKTLGLKTLKTCKTFTVINIAQPKLWR